jgi:hypothetical protein
MNVQVSVNIDEKLGVSIAKAQSPGVYSFNMEISRRTGSRE